MASTSVRLNDNDGQERETARERRLYESRREREFYSYYESVLAYANTEPKFCDLHSPEAVAAHKAITSSDTTLTAFVQLAALQIGTRRAMIFFFDAEYAYIIAESTRTLSFQDDSQHGPDDSLWLGFTKIPRGFSVCEVTADLPANEGSNAQDSHSASLAHIINNLTEDTRFCDRPYVKDGPKARFYAGVPITTPKGINIGALCVLDDEPRDGLEPGQVEFLRSMASTVMSHLELVRAKEENQRSRNMNAALAAFVEGKSDSADWWHCNARCEDDTTTDAADIMKAEPRGPRNRTSNTRVPPTSRTTGSCLENSVADGYFEPNSQEATNDDNGKSPVQLPLNFQVAQDHRSPTESVESSRPIMESRAVSTDTKDSTSPISSPHIVEDTHEDDLPTRVRATLTRAATLIQKGVGADGVLFLDATAGNIGGVIESSHRLSQTETETDGSLISDNSPEQVRIYHHRKLDSASAKKAEEPGRDSVILGSAYPADIEAQVKSMIEQARFSEKVLKSLLRRYPNGKIWHFNEEGDASDEDDELLDEHTSATDAGESAGSELEVEQSTTPTSKRASKRARASKRDGRAIQGMFPGIRSLVFLGMWDPHQDRWFGASIAVSYSSMRIFSAQHELSYIAAFCDVVLAEIWRLEAQDLGRIKNDFVSSISHELRSPLVCPTYIYYDWRSLPIGLSEAFQRLDFARCSFKRLHGILGSAECLDEQDHDALSAELIRSITSCGNTLLDVINDLLEYSRLNHDTQNRKKTQLSGQAGMSSDNSTTASDVSVALTSNESGSDINILTEDAVTAACLGFDLRILQSRDLHGADGDHPATLVLNIEEALMCDWSFSVASGSWKRICMNLVSNALKYTPFGYILVTLRKTLLKRKPSKQQIALVELIVEDSGIGMSEEFQVKSLFRPFRQENNMTPGTGLGLNLVAQIAKSLGGKVHVRSNKGRGTTIKVSLPLLPLASTSSTSSRTSSQDHSSLQASVGFFGFGALETYPTTDPSMARANRRLLSSIKRYCIQFGVSVQTTDDALDSNALIHIVSERALKRLSQTNDRDLQLSLLSTDSLRKPMIVICATRDSASRLRSGHLGTGLPDTTQYLWLPIGPVKLSGALTTCMYCGDRSLRDIKYADRKSNTILAKLLIENRSNAADLGATQAWSGIVEKADGPAQTPPYTDIVFYRQDEGKGDTNGVDSTVTSVMDQNLQGPQSPRLKRSGSEAADKSLTSSLSLRMQINRATTAPCASTGTVSLLLVDDNAINLRLLEVFAKKAGHVYRTAQNGREAVEIYERFAKQQHPLDSDHDPNAKLAIRLEVVLMDINMPVMDGFEAARAIRRFEHTNGSPRATIIAVTALGDTTAQEQAFASGMDLFLTKPVKLKEVTAILSGLRGSDP